MKNFFTDNEWLGRQLLHPEMHRIVDLYEQGYTAAEHDEEAPRNLEEARAGYWEAMRILGALCAEHIAPHAANVDREGPRCEAGRVTYAVGTAEAHRLLVASGLYGMSLERRFGGLNFPVTLFVMASELIARADASLNNLWALQNCAETIATFGTEEQCERFLKRVAAGDTCSMDLTEPEAGSDLQSAMLRASWSEEQGCWMLDGVKRFITNGDADIHLVLARTEAGTNDARGLSLFIYDKRDGGMTVRRIEHKLGIVGSPTCELVFDHARAELVGVQRMGLIKYVMALMNQARLGIGAQSVGIAEAAWRQAQLYAQQRRQFGQPIATFTAVAELLATMRTKLDASRALLYATARQVDVAQGLARQANRKGLEPDERAAMKQAQQRADMYTPMLKLMSGEYCNQITYDAMQVFGGSGYVKDFEVERLYRDARVVTIYEGTSQLQVIAAMKYITNGALVGELRARAEEAAARGGLDYERWVLTELTERFVELIQRTEAEGDAFVELHARRLVECGGALLMCYLLLAEADDERTRCSMRHYVAMTRSLVMAHIEMNNALAPEMAKALLASVQ
nr:acyl-CoA dehydrogenase [Rikenellaceae bacterium]